MERSENLNELFTALSKAQSELANAVKNAENPHFKSKYADIAEIIDAIRPVFSKHGLSIIQSPTYQNGVVTVTTILGHSSGQWVMDSCSAPVAKADPQGLGSGTTYLRRYSAAAFAFLAQADDDGNASSKVTEERPQKTAGAVATGEITPKHWASLAAGMHKTSEAIGRTITQEDLTDFGHKRFGKEHKSEWTKAEYDLCVAWLKLMYQGGEWIDYNMD